MFTPVYTLGTLASKNGVPERIRTSDLRFRKPLHAEFRHGWALVLVGLDEAIVSRVPQYAAPSNVRTRPLASVS